MDLSRRQKSGIGLAFTVVASLLLGACAGPNGGAPSVTGASLGAAAGELLGDPVDALTTYNGPIVGQSPNKFVCTDPQDQTVGLENFSTKDYFFVRFAQLDQTKASFYASVNEDDGRKYYTGIYDKDDTTLIGPNDYNGVTFTGLVPQNTDAGPQPDVYVSQFAAWKMDRQARPAISDATAIVFGASVLTPNVSGWPVNAPSCEQYFGDAFYVPDGGYIMTIDPTYYNGFDPNYGPGYGYGGYGGQDWYRHHHGNDDNRYNGGNSGWRGQNDRQHYDNDNRSDDWRQRREQAYPQP